jgi:Mor family transcriptional regulator
MIHKKALRNREIFSFHMSGKSIGDLARQYGLAKTTVQQIILAEKHLRAVSTEPIYTSARAE